MTMKLICVVSVVEPHLFRSQPQKSLTQSIDNGKQKPPQFRATQTAREEDGEREISVL